MQQNQITIDLVFCCYLWVYENRYHVTSNFQLKVCNAWEILMNELVYLLVELDLMIPL